MLNINFHSKCTHFLSHCKALIFLFLVCIQTTRISMQLYCLKANKFNVVVLYWIYIYLQFNARGACSVGLFTINLNKNTYFVFFVYKRTKRSDFLSKKKRYAVELVHILLLSDLKKKTYDENTSFVTSWSQKTGREKISVRIIFEESPIRKLLLCHSKKLPKLFWMSKQKHNSHISKRSTRIYYWTLVWI